MRWASVKESGSSPRLTDSRFDDRVLGVVEFRCAEALEALLPWSVKPALRTYKGLNAR